MLLYLFACLLGACDCRWLASRLAGLDLSEVRVNATSSILFSTNSANASRSRGRGDLT